MRYFDASALAKRYVREAGSLRIRRLLSSDMAATSRISAVEIASALMRRSREGAFSQGECDRALATLDADLSAMLIAELTNDVVMRARTLLRRYPLRASDAIQLGSALYLQDELGEGMTFVAFDARLAHAARQEGMAKN